MSNQFDEVRAAVAEAKSQIAAADKAAYAMADLLVGRLRYVADQSYSGVTVLRKLKKELRDFDMVTGKFK